MSVYVREDGCIRLGESVTCDGFERDVPIRIQTHTHHDHLKDFERSKGHQSILITRPAFDLLISEFDADLPFRSNIHVVDDDCSFQDFGGVSIAFFPNGHLVGGVFPVVEDPQLGRLAYTSDFSWPIANLPKHVEVLVVDATYGDPTLVRNYRQEDVHEAFLDLVRDELRNGRVVFTGHRGRLQHAAQLLADRFREPFIFTKSAAKTLDVFMRYRGFQVGCLDFHEKRAAELLRSRDRCFIFAETRDRAEIDQLGAARRVYLSAYMCPRERPVAVYDDLIRVALTDHADFDETINLIRAIGPKKVIADNSRGGNGAALAEFVQNELGIPAESNAKQGRKEWGLG